MSNPLEVFYDAVKRQSPVAPRIHWIGESWSLAVLSDLRAEGWSIEVQDPAARLEFLSLPRETRDGVFVEAVPAGWTGDLVQRLLATLFSGLKPGGVAFLGFRDRDPVAMLAWLRQAGFEALKQGASGEINGVLARRIGGASP
jgi:hypothetical protein